MVRRARRRRQRWAAPKSVGEFFKRVRVACARVLADTDDGRKLRAALREYVKDVKAGADPIEALHGHKCGPKCWHNMKPGVR